MNNTIYRIEIALRKGIGFDISFDNSFVGNSWFISIPLFVFVLRFPRVDEKTQYHWEWFNFVNLFRN